MTVNMGFDREYVLVLVTGTINILNATPCVIQADDHNPVGGGSNAGSIGLGSE